MVPTTLHDSGDFRLKSIIYPLFAPLNLWVSYVAHKFGMKSPSDFVMKMIGKQEGMQ